MFYFNIYAFLVLLHSLFGNFISEGSNIICKISNDKKLCFFLNSTLTTFDEAESECVSRKSNLVTITSVEFQESIGNVIDNEKLGPVSNYWIGLKWRDQLLRWQSGYAETPYSPWRNEKEVKVKKCIAISNEKPGNHEWAAHDCSQKFGFICGTLSSLTDASDTMDSLACPAGFVLFYRRCFSFFVEQKDAKTWSEAERACTLSASSAHLATVSSSELQDGFTAAMAGRSLAAWIGLLKSDKTWIDNTLVNYTNWLEPATKHPVESSCTLVNNRLSFLGKWNAVNCSEKHGYICETNSVRRTVSIDKHHFDFLLVRGRCSSGFYEFRSACYTVLPESGVTRSEMSDGDEVTSMCLSSTGLSKMNCASTFGTRTCPIAISPHTNADAAFLRLLTRRFVGKNSSISIFTILIAVEILLSICIHCLCTLLANRCKLFIQIFPRERYHWWTERLE